MHHRPGPRSNPLTTTAPEEVTTTMIHVLAVQLSGSNPDVPPLGALLGVALLVLIFLSAGRKRGRKKGR